MKAMLRHVVDGDKRYDALAFVCPGCAQENDGLHMVPVNTTETSPAWNWDGNLEAPTITPSILTKWGEAPYEHVCHSFLNAGVFDFLDDSTHQHAGLQVHMPDLPDWVTQRDGGMERNRDHESQLIDSHIRRETDSQKLDRILALLEQLSHKEIRLMGALEDLQTEVANNTSVEASALALIQSLADQIAAAGTDQAALQAIVDQLRSNDSALAAAVASNTPASSDDGSGVDGAGNLNDGSGSSPNSPTGDGTSADSGATQDGSTDTGASDGSDQPAPGV